MNTNQDTALTNQDAFEKWLDTERGAGKAITEGMYRAYSAGHQAATKASEQRIQELEAEVMKAQSYFMKSQRELRELQAHVNQLREALVVCKEYITEVIIDDRYHEATCSLDDLYLLRDKAINLYKLTVNATPEQSLAEHDNATIDRCKNIVADDALAITFQSMGAYRSAIIKHIGELKVTP